MAKLPREQYDMELREMQVELNSLARWMQDTGQRILIIFEGRDTAGKGGAIRSISDRLNPRMCHVIALPKPTERESTQWYFQRYVSYLPAAGEIVLFDRSWYNRPGVERVMGYCSEKDVEDFFRLAPGFERALTADGIRLFKYFLTCDQKPGYATILVAGIVLSTMLVPVGIAYAVASGVPAINGLYATIIPLLVYALFGPSRHPGPRTGFVARADHPRRRPALVCRRSPAGGRDWPARWPLSPERFAFSRVSRLGFITELLSKPIRYGYMNGIALAVLISQLPEAVRLFKIESTGPLRDLWAIGKPVSNGKANWTGPRSASATLVVILCSKAHKRMGAILIAVIARR
jgi:hypothetical protein